MLTERETPEGNMVPYQSKKFPKCVVFSERELKFMFANVIVRPSVVCRLSSVVCLSSVTFVRPTQTIEIFGKFLRHLVPWPSVTFV